ncbi:MAG: hypothetical protein KAJ52_06405 [Sedimentisphaerales bacterium]|nr:hypothetical protein [Sedimentisphaerales bacterium]
MSIPILVIIRKWRRLGRDSLLIPKKVMMSVRFVPNCWGLSAHASWKLKLI